MLSNVKAKLQERVLLEIQKQIMEQDLHIKPTTPEIL